MSTQTQTGPASISAVLLQGLDLFDEELQHVSAGHWQLPTPCAGWSVEDLVRHAADTADRATAILNGAAWEPSSSAAPAAERWRESAAALRGTIAGTGIDDRWPLPEDSPQAKLRFHGCDFTVHRWDLSVALGREHELPAGWVAYMDGFFRSLPAGAIRRPRAFAASVDPAPADGPTRQLMAFLGRRPVAQ